MTSISFENQLSTIPLGIMMPAKAYHMPNPRVQGLVLEQMTNFDPSRYLGAHRTYFNTWVLGGPRMPMLLFSLQLEDVRLSWLADPADSTVWDAIDTWNSNRSVSVAMSHGETHMFVVPLHSKSDEQVNLLRRLKNKPVADIFTAQAIDVLSQGLVDGLEIPGLPAPLHTNTCLLHTAGVERALKRRGYESKFDATAQIYCARQT